MKRVAIVPTVFVLVAMVAACTDTPTSPAGEPNLLPLLSEGAVLDRHGWNGGSFRDADGDFCQIVGAWDSQGNDDYTKALPNNKVQHHGSGVVDLTVIPAGGPVYTGQGTATWNVTDDGNGIDGVFMARGKVTNADGDKGQVVCRANYRDGVRVKNEVDLH